MCCVVDLTSHVTHKIEKEIHGYTSGSGEDPLASRIWFAYMYAVVHADLLQGMRYSQIAIVVGRRRDPLHSELGMYTPARG